MITVRVSCGLHAGNPGSQGVDAYLGRSHLSATSDTTQDVPNEGRTPSPPARPSDPAQRRIDRS